MALFTLLALFVNLVYIYAANYNVLLTASCGIKLHKRQQGIYKKKPKLNITYMYTYIKYYCVKNHYLGIFTWDKIIMEK